MTNHSTLRRLSGCVAATIAVATLSSGLTSSRADEPPIPVVTATAASSSHAVGDTFDVDATIADGRDVASIRFTLVWDPAVLRLVPPAEEGPFMRGDGAVTAFTAADAASGEGLDVGIKRTPDEPGSAVSGASGSATLASFRFEALAEGSSPIRFRNVAVENPFGVTVQVRFRAGRVEVGQRK